MIMININKVYLQYLQTLIHLVIHKSINYPYMIKSNNIHQQ
jgi:hypothetical protein